MWVQISPKPDRPAPRGQPEADAGREGGPNSLVREGFYHDANVRMSNGRCAAARRFVDRHVAYIALLSGSPAGQPGPAEVCSVTLGISRNRQGKAIISRIPGIDK